MPVLKVYIQSLLLIIGILSLNSCSCGEHDRYVRHEVDSLNSLSYAFHYVSIDSVERYARKALRKAQPANYSDGRDEALCNLGFAKFMRMDYDSASTYLNEVINNSPNELYRLVADVTMMKVCQRRSLNQAFYDYHNDAQNKMERIRPETQTMTERQRDVWNYAVSEYHMTLHVYYFYMRQEEEAEQELALLSEHTQLTDDDAAQKAMWLFLLGNSKNVDNRLSEDNSELLLRAATAAKSNGLNYIMAKALTSVAEDIVKDENYRPSRMTFVRELVGASDSVRQEQMPMEICNFSLRIFKDYGSLFDVGQTFNTISEFYIATGDNEKALMAMDNALACVNEHHRMVAKDSDILYPFDDSENQDTLSTEMKWIRDSVVCVPEWMADIREHFCIVYSALGQKKISDYNRNVFLDIRDITRQDKKMEQLYSTLRTEQAEVDRLMILSAILLFLLAVAGIYLTRRIRNNYRINYIREQKSVEGEMRRWREKTDMDFLTLEERQEMARAEKDSKERRLEEQVRQYVNKATCLSIVHSITPFLDRVVNEVGKIRQGSGDVNRRLQYVDELTERINIYNDILADWVKIRQGAVALNIENFELKPLFAIMLNNTRTFKNKGVELQVEQNDFVVKADRALTLFMMNTLLDNARKYSPQHTTVRLAATDEGDCIEISVTDQGQGLSQDDVNTILGEKVYDSSKIGLDNGGKDLKEKKGFGFGLLNCKGIIEKYRKTSDLFKVCSFGIESEQGKGSRFFFRLPKGIMRNLAILAAWFLPFMFVGCQQSENNADGSQTDMPIDDVHSKIGAMPDDHRISRAYNFTAAMLEMNLEGHYEEALAMADSVINMLNSYYISVNPESKKLLKLYDEEVMAEVEWWNEGFVTDYQTIIQMRNEAAIAALALKRWDLYHYNNEIFNRLHKLSSQDVEMERRCSEIKDANSNRKTMLALLVLAIIAGAMIYYFIYYRNNILPTFELRQILELNRRIFNNNNEGQLATIIRQGINDIRRTEGVALYMKGGTTLFSENCPKQDYMGTILRQASESQSEMTLDEGRTRIYPLTTDTGNCIGMVAFLLGNGNVSENDLEMLRKISRYTAENIYYSNVRMRTISDDIELIDDERRRAEREGNMVHVQNMVIDNTLSTIKHETMYYPNRIRQIVDSLKNNKADENVMTVNNEEQVRNMEELTLYYKDVFTILADCAAKQLQRPMFKRRFIAISEVVEEAQRAVKRCVRKTGVNIKFISSDIKTGNKVVADRTMIMYLVDNIVEAMAQEKTSGTLSLDFDISKDFTKFAFSFDNIVKNEEQTASMFYPETLRFNMETNELQGAQWLIAKQIIREHDEHIRRGCRIEAVPGNPGLTVSFSIPTADKN